MLTISPFKSNSNSKSKSNQSFGLSYSKGFVNFLKRDAINLVENERDYEFTKLAIENFGKLKKRNDGLVLDVEAMDDIFQNSPFLRLKISDGPLIDDKMHARVENWDLKRCEFPNEVLNLPDEKKQEVYYHAYPKYLNGKPKLITDAEDLFTVSQYLGEESTVFNSKMRLALDGKSKSFLENDFMSSIFGKLNSIYEKLVLSASEITPDKKNKISEINKLIDEQLTDKA